MRITRLTTILALSLLAAPLSAQDEDERRPHEGVARDEIPKILDAYLLSNLQERLGLSDAQHDKLLPLVIKYQRDGHNLRKDRMKALGALKKLLQSGSATEAQIADQLKSLRSLENDDRARLKSDVDAIDAELSIVQQAKFRVLEQEVERRFFQLMKQAIVPGGRRPRDDKPVKPHKEPEKPLEAPAPTKP